MDLEKLALDVGGLRRTYWLARGADENAPLLMVLHGSGTTGRNIATAFTGLATRGGSTRPKSSWIRLLWSNNFRRLIVCAEKKIV